MNMYTTPQLKQLHEAITRQLQNNNITIGFSPETAAMRREDLPAMPCPHRRDLRSLPAFTIDRSDCRDMDDAVSLETTACGCRLGVHIADVSSYVRQGSALDEEVRSRGASIYLPGLTIPMLPPVLTEDLCSLRPEEDRPALSVLISLDHCGRVMDCTITKSLIRSRVKGVYEETDALLAGTAGPALHEKYASVAHQLPAMAALAAQLRCERELEGAAVSGSSPARIVLRGGRISLESVPASPSSQIIEEFMILANRLVAEYMRAQGLPTIYRTHPAQGKQACYRPISEHHAALALQRYCHFTAPIRRYVDLLVHRSLSLYLSGLSARRVNEIFTQSLDEDTDADEVCRILTSRSRRAKAVQNYVERFCYALYFHWQGSRTTYSGRVISLDCRQRPIIELDDYHIRVIGASAVREWMGRHVTLNVQVNDRNELRACHTALQAS